VVSFLRISSSPRRVAAGSNRLPLVTITGVTGGAVGEVPRRLGQVFSAFWNHHHASYPAGMTVERLP
jgi:hypothetical protein